MRTHSYINAPTHTHTHRHLHSLSPSRSVWHDHTLFHFKKSWLQGRRHVFLYITCCLTLSVSVHPSPPGRLDYISALVRPGDVFTQIISFISCPSIHPPIRPSTLPSISFLEPLSVHLCTQTCMCYNGGLSSHFTFGSAHFSLLLFCFFLPIALYCHSLTFTSFVFSTVMS